MITGYNAGSLQQTQDKCIAAKQCEPVGATVVAGEVMNLMSRLADRASELDKYTQNRLSVLITPVEETPCPGQDKAFVRPYPQLFHEMRVYLTIIEEALNNIDYTVSKVEI